MKNKTWALFLFCLGISLNAISQFSTIARTDKEVYTVEGDYYFIITKKDIESNKILFKAETNIPDKKQKETYNTSANDARFFLVGENIFIIYDVWQKSNSSKECYVRLLNTKTGQFGEKKRLYATPLNSGFSAGDIPYTPQFSADFSKLAVLKDNKSTGYDIDPEITVYDTKTLNIISNKKFAQKYNGEKRIFSQNFTVDNTGNISLFFSLLNPETKQKGKSFSANIGVKDTELQNIKELEPTTSSSDSKIAVGGLFYKSLQDYVDSKPMEGVGIKYGSFSWTTFGGTKFKLIDDKGNVTKEDAKDLPSDIFTYNDYLIHVIDKTPYIVLSVGKLCFYAEYAEQQKRYMAEGWNGKLEKFKEDKLEDYLKQYGLLEGYKRDKPKREFKDDVNGYFNKVVRWQIDYFNLLNKKMK
jgi:hypothetical protein